MPDKVKFALVGTGNMGRHNAQRVITDGRGEIVAICDSSGEAAERAAAELGVADTFTEIDALIADGDFDAAIVATPNIVHAPLSVALLDAGKHVYCEKPPASDVAGAKAVVAAADKAAGAGHQYRAAHRMKSGRTASRGEITLGSKGHSMAKVGSFQRTPRAKSGTKAAPMR